MPSMDTAEVKAYVAASAQVTVDNVNTMENEVLELPAMYSRRKKVLGFVAEKVGPENTQP